MITTIVVAKTYNEFLTIVEKLILNRRDVLFINGERAIKGLNLNNLKIILGKSAEETTAFPIVSEELERRNLNCGITSFLPRRAEDGYE